MEGGPSVARGFLAEGLVDRAIIVRAPMEFSRPVPSDISTDTLQRLVGAGNEDCCFRGGGNAVVRCALYGSIIHPARLLWVFVFDGFGLNG